MEVFWSLKVLLGRKVFFFYQRHHLIMLHQEPFQTQFSLMFLQLYEILARTPYGSPKKGEVGIDRLMSEQVFTAAYPLHEVRSEPKLSSEA